LIYQVAGTTDVAWFLEGGARAARGIQDLLAQHGQPLEELSAMLDFGCGVGRVLRHWTHLKGPAIHGCDYQPAGIAWCQQHLDHARTCVNRLQPPLPYDASTFDLIYALSVFTHLSASAQIAWMWELGRVIRYGGWLYLTLHGDAYRHMLNPQERARYDRGELVVRGPREGSNHRAAFHPRAYLNGKFTQGWSIIEHQPAGAPGNPVQDVLLLRKN
jgi:SAM-dependent methyltransferase